MPKPVARELKSGEKRWHVQFRLPNRKSPVVEVFATKREAQNFCDLIDDIGPVKAVEARDYITENPNAYLNNLETLLENYLTHCASYATPGTVDEYRKLGKRTWLRYFRTQPAETLSEQDISSWVAWQRQQQTVRGTRYSAKTIKNAHGLLSSVLAHAVKQKLIPANVAHGTRLPKDTIKDGDTYITVDEYTRIISAMTNANARLLVTFLFSTGTRWGEATAVQVRDIDFSTNPATININKAWKKDEKNKRYLGAPKTSRSIRRISIPNTLTMQLQEHIETLGKQPDDLLFSTLRGKRVDYHMFMRTFWKPALQRANITTNPGLHKLRHGYASALIQAGEILPVIQRQLGHESIKTTVDRYGHLTPAAMNGVAARMDSILSPAHPLLEN